MVDGKSWGEAALNGLKSAAITGIAGVLLVALVYLRLQKLEMGIMPVKKFS